MALPPSYEQAYLVSNRLERNRLWTVFTKVSTKQTVKYGDMVQSILRQYGDTVKYGDMDVLDNMHLVQGFLEKLLNKHILILINVGWMDSHKVDQDPRGFQEPASPKVKNQLQDPCRRDKVITGLSFKLWIKLLLSRASGMAMKGSIKINGAEYSHLEIPENGEVICFCGSYSHQLDSNGIMVQQINKRDTNNLWCEYAQKWSKHVGIRYRDTLSTTLTATSEYVIMFSLTKILKVNKKVLCLLWEIYGDINCINYRIIWLSYIFSSCSLNNEYHYKIKTPYLELNKDEGYDLLNEEVKMFKNGYCYLSNLNLINVLIEEAFNYLFIGDTNNDTSMSCPIMIVSEPQKIGSDKVRRTINLANATERIYESGLNGKILNESEYIKLSKDHRLYIIPHDHDTNGHQDIYGTDKERYRKDTKLNIKTMKSNNGVFCRQYDIKHKGTKSIQPILSIVLWVYCRSLNTCTGLRQTVKTKDINYNIREHWNWSTYLIQSVQCFGDSYYQLTPTKLNDDRYYITDIIVKYSITTATTSQLPDITLNTARIITFKRHCNNILSEESDDLYSVKYLSRSKCFESNNHRAKSGLYDNDDDAEDINDIENKDEVLSDKETSILSDVYNKHLMNTKISNVNIDEDDTERVSTDNTSPIPNNNTLNDDENTLYIGCSFKALSVLNEILDPSSYQLQRKASDIMHRVLYYSLQELGQCLSDLTGFIDYDYALTLRLLKIDNASTLVLYDGCSIQLPSHIKEAKLLKLRYDLYWVYYNDNAINNEKDEMDNDAEDDVVPIPIIGSMQRTMSYIISPCASNKENVLYLETYNDQGNELLNEAKMYENEDGIILLLNLSNGSNEELIGDLNGMGWNTSNNDTSSRSISYCKIIIIIESQKMDLDKVHRLKLNEVHLAASERVYKSGLNGKILKESKQILKQELKIVNVLNNGEENAIYIRQTALYIIQNDQHQNSSHKRKINYCFECMKQHKDITIQNPMELKQSDCKSLSVLNGTLASSSNQLAHRVLCSLLEEGIVFNAFIPKNVVIKEGKECDEDDTNTHQCLPTYNNKENELLNEDEEVKMFENEAPNNDTSSSRFIESQKIESDKAHRLKLNEVHLAASKRVNKSKYNYLLQIQELKPESKMVKALDNAKENVIEIQQMVQYMIQNNHHQNDEKTY